VLGIREYAAEFVMNIGRSVRETGAQSGDRPKRGHSRRACRPLASFRSITDYAARAKVVSRVVGGKIPLRQAKLHAEGGGDQLAF
jgi:hypothetical protein